VVGEHRRSWQALDADVDALAATLVERGLARGERCAVLAPNGAGFVLAFFAALRAGAVVVPVGARLAPTEVAHIVEDSGAVVLLFDPEHADTAQVAAKGAWLGSLGPCSGFEDVLSSGFGPAPALRVEDVDEQDDAIIMYTSGTTGKPKGVLLDHHRAIWAAMSEVASLGLRDGERYLHLAPLHHSGGIVFLVTTTLLGGTHVVLEAFEPVAVLDAIERERCTFFLAVPTMFAFLLRVPRLAHRDLSSWRLSVFGAAPMPRATLEAMLAAFPSVELVQLCGQTEGGPGGIYSTAEQVRAQPEVTGHQAMVFYESRVVEAGGDDDTEPGRVGELVLRGEGVMKGYWNQPEATARTLRDGWLHTGDLVRRDPDGAMTLVDRLKDLIITGGQNVYSAEVELIVADHPAVVDCAVVGRPHAEYGESIVAFVVASADRLAPTPEELRDFCRGRIARYKAPHDVVVIDVIPRNAAGKALKHELRRLV